MALLPGSPALGVGDDSIDPATDQRGLPRISGQRVDLGAFELQVEGPPVFTGYGFSSPGQFQLRFRGVVDSGYSVLATPDVGWPLSNWSLLGPATPLSNGLFQFNDTQATNFPQRFYRVRQP